MKILFLDIDGVLNSVQSAHFYHDEWVSQGKPEGRTKLRKEELCPIACSNLRYILNQVDDLMIVVSSTWRLGRSLDEMKTIMGYAGVRPERVLDMTPRFYGAERGHEIQGWLSVNATEGAMLLPKYQVDNFVIVDDDSDMVHLMDRLVQTSHKTGLTWTEVEEILIKLRD